MGDSLVSGTIVFDSARPDLSDATIHVRLEDTSLMDGPSRVVSERLLRVSEEDRPTDGIPFTLRERSPDPRTSYSVSVHVDITSSGTLDEGDYVSTESYPVLTFGHPDRVTVEVRRIG